MMSPYAAVHASPQGAGDARPTALQIIHDEELEGKLVGKVIVITGTSSGIGISTARALSATGATLILTARDLKKAETVFSDILGKDRVWLVEMDNTSFTSVRAAATTILRTADQRVNVLINNAGIMGVPDLRLTDDGHEVHFATNYLSHFLLFQLLKPALLRSASPEFPSRVVNVSSSSSRVADLMQSDNYNFQNGGYHYGLAYANSKLAGVYMANELERRYGDRNLHATSLQPGFIDTDITRFLGPEFVAQMLQIEEVVRLAKTIEQGAATTVIAAVGKEWASRGGKYLEDCQEAQRGVDDHSALSLGYVKQTYDEVNERRLWRDSLKIVGIEDDA